jgi:hypothetical protein
MRDSLIGAAAGIIIGAGLAVSLIEAFPPPAVAEARQEIKERRQVLARDIGSECVIEPAGRDCQEVCDLLAGEELELACQAGMSSGYLFNTITQAQEE